MKNKLLYLTFLLPLFIFNACDINDLYTDYDPPAEPRNIVVLNGDNRVDLYWDHNRDSDLSGYNIYYAYSYDGKYTLIGSTSSNYFIDDGASNGQTLYYAVTAYDYNGNESELSVDVIYATPRPEGFNQAIFDYIRFPDNSGYSFDEYLVLPYDDLSTDFFFENYNGTFYLDVWDDTDIQDMGPTTDIYDIPFAPISGWSTTKDEIAKVGHTYVIWTWDNHYAKVRVKAITADRIIFDWAYQLLEGNRELKLKAVPDEREPLTRMNKIRTHSSSNQSE